MLAVTANIPATFSFGILFTLLLILLSSGCVFYVLTRQWTDHRPLQALREWATGRRFKLRLPPDVTLPDSLSGLQSFDPQIQAILTRGPLTLIRLTTILKPAAPRQAWNLIIRETAQSQNPAGLRPVAAKHSFLDLFAMTGFPSILPPDRFVVYAVEARDARKLAASHVRGLLPADIGFLIHGPFVTLDFSTRPFDPIEFERMIIIMEQIVQS